jgi:hypothetical protein
MNTQTNPQNKNEYMLLFRGTDWSKTLSPEEMQRVSSQWMDWFKRLSEQGKVVGGRPLDHTGKVVSGKNGRSISDGPFAESKEAIGGYFLLNVSSLDEAVAIAQQCPGLAYGAVVEVRPMMDACPTSGEPVPQIELATAHA